LTIDKQVTAATQPSFLQQAVHLDAGQKRLTVLGEIDKRFVVSPDIDALLADMILADTDASAGQQELGEGLLRMDED
jgi:DNA-directed RNA polymerase III subunit RPC4